MTRRGPALFVPGFGLFCPRTGAYLSPDRNFFNMKRIHMYATSLESQKNFLQTYVMSDPIRPRGFELRKHCPIADIRRRFLSGKLTIPDSLERYVIRKLLMREKV